MVRRSRHSGGVATAAAEHELAVYEGLRAGRRDAFAVLALDLDAVLRDLARVATGDPGRTDTLVRHTWEMALAGLDLFAWRCSLRAWVAGVLVGWAGMPDQAIPPAPASGAPAPLGPALPAPGGPVDWSDLPWGARWSDGAWEALAGARAALPVVGQQALLLRDGHGWSDRDTCDALGLTEARYRAVLAGARLTLHDALATATRTALPACGHDRAAVGAGEGPWPACPHCAVLAARLGRVAGLVPNWASRPATRPDPALLAVFRRWRAARRAGLRQRLERLRGDAAFVRAAMGQRRSR